MHNSFVSLKLPCLFKKKVALSFYHFASLSLSILRTLSCFFIGTSGGPWGKKNKGVFGYLFFAFCILYFLPFGCLVTLHHNSFPTNEFPGFADRGWNTKKNNNKKNQGQHDTIILIYNPFW